MPIKETDEQVYEYPTSRLGVNLSKDIVELNEEECIQSKNLVWSNGMVKRGGQSLVTDEEVVAGHPVVGLHKFYMADGSNQLLAACGDSVKYLSGTSWTEAKAGLSVDTQTYMSTWGALNKVYICNGIDKMWSWDGTSATDITLADSATYGVPRMALPYQDRLLTIMGGILTWSASYSDAEGSWEPASNCGIRPDTMLYGMTYHAVSNEQAGYDTKVLLAGASGMYLFAAKSLIAPFTEEGSDYALFPLAIPVGCNAPRTMCWTPQGTMWLGTNRQVYLLPFDSISPVAVGNKIHSNIGGIYGLESIPQSQIQNACATYHNGYYILSVAITGGSNNTYQWWANIDRAAADDDGNYGPWYGPMQGQSIGCFASQNGSQDGGELLGGEGNATSPKGYVYYLNDKSDTSDVEVLDGSSKSIHCGWQTYYNKLGNTYMRKDIHKIELELLDVLGAVNVSFLDIEGSLTSSKTASLSGTAVYWNDNYWGEAYWSSGAPTRVVIDLSPAIHARRVSMLIEHNIATDRFELYAARVAAIDQGQIFE